MHSSFIEGEIVNINTLEVVQPVLTRFSIILLKLLIENIENVENDKKSTFRNKIIATITYSNS